MPVLVHVVSRTTAPPAHPTNGGGVFVPPPPPAAHTVTTQPTTIQQAAGVMTVNPAATRWFGPIFNLPTFAANHPLSFFTLPTLISPVATPVDTTLFQEPQDAAKKHYLPGYTIATANDGTYLVSFGPTGKSCQLVVHLTETPNAQAATSIRIDAPTRYWLTATIRGQVRSFDFQEAVDGKTLKLTLPVQQKSDQDWIFQAMTDPTAAARLILTRGLNLATLGPMQPAVPAVAGHPAIPGVAGHPAIPAVAGHPAIPGFLGRPMIPAVAGRPAIPAVAGHPAIPALAGHSATPAVQLYHANPTATIDTTIPFTFIKELNQNIFAQLVSGTDGGKAPAPWTIVRIPFGQTTYPYYQNRTQPDQFLFLPDAFKIARSADANNAPMLTVQSNGQTADAVVLTLSYVAQPVWSSDRIAAAIKWLQQGPQPLSSAPQLALFDASNTALSLKLPAKDNSAPVVMVPQPGAQIQIAAGVKGSVAMSLGQFQQVYDALFDNVSDLLTGQVTVTVDQDAGQDVQAVPFIARASDFVGDITAITTSFDPVANSLSCVVKNAIESPLQIDRLGVLLSKNGTSVPNTVEQITPALPVTLVPASTGGTPTSAVDTLTVKLQLAANQSVDQATQVLFDYSGTRVLPDAKALWLAIMKNQVVAPVVRPILVKLVAAVLAPAPAASGPTTPTTPPADDTAASASDPILAVQVEFEGQNATADFESADTVDASGIMSKTVNLSVPMEAYVLHEADTGTYRYRVHLITRHSKKTGDWSEDSVDSLFVSVD